MNKKILEALFFGIGAIAQAAILVMGLTGAADIAAVMYLVLGVALLVGGAVYFLRWSASYTFLIILISTIVPAVGCLLFLLLRVTAKPETVETKSERSWVVGNPSRYRYSPVGLPSGLSRGVDLTQSECSLLLRRVESREDVEGLSRLRDSEDPFASLFAGSALETQFDWLERRLTQLRNQVALFPDCYRSRRMLAEALLHQVSLKDPSGATGEGSRALEEANVHLAKIGIQSPKLETNLVSIIEEKIRVRQWDQITEAIPSHAEPLIRKFWKVPNESN